jgi:hypothetical protein
MGNANDHACLPASSNFSQYGVHTLPPPTHAGDVAGTGTHTFEEIGRSWPLILDMPYLFFCEISLFPFLGPIAGIGLFIPGVAT